MHAGSTSDTMYFLGYITRENKKKGALEAFLDTDVAASYKTLKQVWVAIHGQHIPFDISIIAINAQKAVIRFVSDPAINLSEMVGCQLYLPNSQLPTLKGSKQFYYHEVIGYTVIDNKSMQQLGVITKINDSGPQSYFEVSMPGTAPLIIPVVNNFIEKIDKKEKTILFNLPNGLINVYRHP